MRDAFTLVGGDASAVQRDGTKLRGKVTVGDAWYDLDCVVEQGAAAGTCNGAVGAKSVNGTLTGTVQALAATCKWQYQLDTVQYRIPAQLPAGEEPVRCLPLKAEDGWLTDPRLENPKHAPAPYREYTGDKTEAMWQYDREIAEVSDA